MRLVLTILVAAALSIAGTLAFLNHQKDGSVAAAKETAYERVIRTGTIRCGYGVGAPYAEMDPNTKEMKGFAVDVTNAVAKNLNLKVEWTEETGWGGIVPALNEGRVDLGCSALWVSAPISREALFTDVFLYNSMYYYVRQDDDRLETVNDLLTKNAKIIYTEGGNTQEVIAKRMFPESALVPYSREAQTGAIFLDIAAGKADAVMNEPATVAIYNAKADVKLRPLDPDRPTVTVGNAFPLAKGETMLKNMIDTALHEMLANGELAQIIKPYQDATPGAYFLPSPPYTLQP